MDARVAAVTLTCSTPADSGGTAASPQQFGTPKTMATHYNGGNVQQRCRAGASTTSDVAHYSSAAISKLLSNMMQRGRQAVRWEATVAQLDHQHGPDTTQRCGKIGWFSDIPFVALAYSTKSCDN